MIKTCKLAAESSLLQVYLLPGTNDRSNSYLIAAAEGAYLIDPSVTPDMWGDYASKVRMIFATHGHYDHIRECDNWRAVYPTVPLCIEKDEAEHMQHAVTNVSTLFGCEAEFAAPDRLLEPNEVVKLEKGIELTVLHTPGHTPGSSCYLLKTAEEGPLCLFTGDTLFSGSVGRFDFPGGNAMMMKSTIDYMCSLAAVLHLPEKFPVYPGHGACTDLDYECRYNLFLNGTLHI